MLNRSRRQARETALRVLYEIELGKANIREAIESSVIETEISHDLAEYMERLVVGVRDNRRELDNRISEHLRDYEIDRLAIIDKNILRIAAFELIYVEEMPPGVTINEAIEISRRFSTTESAKFINGVLGSLIRKTSKANWDPDKAPPEFTEDFFGDPDDEIEVEELEVTPESDSFRVASRIGGWKLKND